MRAGVIFGVCLCLGGGACLFILLLAAEPAADIFILVFIMYTYYPINHLIRVIIQSCSHRMGVS